MTEERRSEVHSGDRAGEQDLVMSLGQRLVSRSGVKRDSLTMAVGRWGTWVMGGVIQQD